MHKTGNCLAKCACQNSVTSVNHIPVLVSSYGNEMHFCFFCFELFWFSQNNWQNGWLGRFVLFVCCMLGKCLIKFWEKFPKFGKNKMRTVRPPLKDPQGLVQMTLMLVSFLWTRNVRETEECWSGYQERGLWSQFSCTCYAIIQWFILHLVPRGTQYTVEERISKRGGWDRKIRRKKMNVGVRLFHEMLLCALCAC